MLKKSDEDSGGGGGMGKLCKYVLKQCFVESQGKSVAGEGAIRANFLLYECELLS